MKNLFLMIFGFALLGVALVAWFAPSAIRWYFEPPVDILNCAPATEWAMQRLIYAEAMGLAGGVILALLIFFFMKKKKSVGLNS